MAELTSFVTVNAKKGLIAMLLMTVGTFVLAELLLARQSKVPATEATVASKRTKDLTIAITSAEGGLKGGENSFCVMFQKRGTEEPVEVQNVRVDFTLLVGRVQEEPIRAHLTRDRVGSYCGHGKSRQAILRSSQLLCLCALHGCGWEGKKGTTSH